MNQINELQVLLMLKLKNRILNKEIKYIYIGQHYLDLIDNFDNPK